MFHQKWHWSHTWIISPASHQRCLNDTVEDSKMKKATTLRYVRHSMRCALYFTLSEQSKNNNNASYVQYCWSSSVCECSSASLRLFFVLSHELKSNAHMVTPKLDLLQLWMKNSGWKTQNKEVNWGVYRRRLIRVFISSYLMSIVPVLYINKPCYLDAG